MTTAAKTTTKHVNGIDVPALFDMIDQVKRDPAKGMARFHVTSSWRGQTRSQAKVDSYGLGGQDIRRSFTIAADEPFELLGENTAPNPQELLMAAMNACMLVGYVAGAAVNGVTLEKLEIETDGTLDLRGFLGIDERVKPGYDSITYTVRVRGNGTPEQFRQIHENVRKTSPNYFNMANPIRLDGTLVVE
jgi:uncharacterized OsmC-like protein